MVWWINILLALLMLFETVLSTSNEVSQSDVCQAFCLLNCKQVFGECISKCYRRKELIEMKQKCIANKCRTAACDIEYQPNARDVSIKVNQINYSETAVGSIEFLIGTNLFQEDEKIYLVQELDYGSDDWEIKNTLKNKYFTSDFKPCQVFRVAAVSLYGTSLYSKKSKPIPAKLFNSSIRLRAIHQEKVFTLVLINWDSPLGWNSSFLTGYRVQIDAHPPCILTEATFNGQIDRNIPSREFIIKIRPTSDGKCDLKIKITPISKCNTGETTEKYIKINCGHGKPCREPNQRLSMWKQDDLVLSYNATALYGERGYYALVQFTVSNLLEHPSETNFTIYWQEVTSYEQNVLRLPHISMYSVKGTRDRGVMIGTLIMNRTYGIVVRQGNHLDATKPIFKITLDEDLKIQYEKKKRLSNPKRTASATTPSSQLNVISFSTSLLSLLVIFIIFIIVMFSGVFFFVLRKNKNCSRSFQPPSSFVGSSAYMWSAEDKCLSEHRREYDSWEVSHDDIHLSDVIVQGSYGAIYKGFYTRSNSINKTSSHESIINALQSTNTENVLVKCLSESVSETDKCCFLEEIEILKHLRHMNILRMIGCNTSCDAMYVVLEDPCICDVLSYLRAFKTPGNGNPFANPAYNSLKSMTRSAMWRSTNTDIIAPSDALLSDFCRQICNGMKFIASNQLVHRDLACRNVMLTVDYNVKIGDYAMVRYAYDNADYVARSTGRLPAKWMSIEAIASGMFSTKSDVWSFGVVLYELCTLGAVPYPNIPSSELLKTLQMGHRMERPLNASIVLYEIMLETWADEPESRPTFASLFEKLSVSQVTPLIELHLGKRSPPSPPVRRCGDTPPPTPPRCRLSEDNAEHQVCLSHFPSGNYNSPLADGHELSSLPRLINPADHVMATTPHHKPPNKPHSILKHTTSFV